MNTLRQVEESYTSTLRLKWTGRRVKLIVLACPLSTTAIDFLAFRSKLHNYTIFPLIVLWDPATKQHKKWGFLHREHYHPGKDELVYDANVGPSQLMQSDCQSYFPRLTHPTVPCQIRIADILSPRRLALTHCGSLIDLAQAISNRGVVFTHKVNFGDDATSPDMKRLYASTHDSFKLDAATRLLIEQCLPYVCVECKNGTDAVATMRKWEVAEKQLFVWRLQHTFADKLDTVLKTMYPGQVQVAHRETQPKLFSQCDPMFMLEGMLIGVPFELALPLVSKRKCFLQRGVAWISYSQIHHLFGYWFESNMTTPWDCVDLTNPGAFLRSGQFRRFLRPALLDLVADLVPPPKADFASSQSDLPLPPCMRLLVNKPRNLKFKSRQTFGYAIAALHVPFSAIQARWKPHLTRQYAKQLGESSNILKYWGVQSKKYTKSVGPTCQNMCESGLCPFAPRLVSTSGTVTEKTVINATRQCGNSVSVNTTGIQYVKHVAMQIKDSKK